MAARKTEIEENIIEEPAQSNDGFGEMVIHSQQEEKYTGPTARVFLPKLEDPGDAGLKVDQYEHVTIANEEREKTWYIHRGEWVDIPWFVYVVLKEKYPDI